MLVSLSPVPLSLLLPLTSGLVAFGAGRRAARFVGVLGSLGTFVAVLWLALTVSRAGPQRYAVSGWRAPLGLELYADGVSVSMLLLTAVVGVAVSLYALGYFTHEAAHGRGRERGGWLEADSFWPLWLILWAAMNALYLSSDLFNLYVTLELVTLAAVGLVILSGEQVSLTAGLRYLLAALAGSLFYLFGLSLVYAHYGTLYLAALPPLLTPDTATDTVTGVALALMTVGLLVKTALWPFHVWLPPAHASAAAPVSALLSALVVKGAFYIVLRLWWEVFPAALPPLAYQGLGALGAAAILWGSLQAVRQSRLKLLVAYSTVAQLGYLFLLFPLGVPAAGLLHALAHALAKASLFMVAGTLILARGSDALPDLKGAARRLPLSGLAFALGAWTLLGLPPSAGYASKELLLEATQVGGQGAWEVPLRAGALLAAVYLGLALRPMLARAPEGAFRRVPLGLQLLPLALALLAALLGVLPYEAALRALEVGG